MQTKFNEMVMKLKKPGADILASLTPEKADLWHMVTGLIGELIELDEARWKGDTENALEELGDCLFYLEGICQNLGISPGYTSENKVKHSFGGDILDLIKKVVAYGQEPKLDKIKEDIDGTYSYLSDLIQLYKFTMDQVLEHNMNKLLSGKNARYKDGYSDQAAKERADKASTSV